MSLLRNPHAIIESVDGEMKILNFYYGTEVAYDAEIAAIWHEAGLKQLRIDQKSSRLEELYRKGFLIPENELSFRAAGLDQPRLPAIGAAKRVLEHTPSAGEKIVLGVPSDRGSKSPGARMGPRLIRQAFAPFSNAIRDANKKNIPLVDFATGRKYDASSIKLFDFGDLIDDQFASASALFERADFVIQRINSAGATPIILGGDHSVSASAVLNAAPRCKRPILLMFDAHHDCYASTFDQRKSLNHGNFVYHLLERDSIGEVIQIGLRTFEAVPSSLPHLNGRISFVTADQFSNATDLHVLASLPEDADYYVTIDLDVLPPWIGGSTPTAVFGGIDPRRLLNFLDLFFRSRRVVGFDIVEAQSNSDSQAVMFDAAARILLTMVLASAEFEKINDAVI